MGKKSRLANVLKPQLWGNLHLLLLIHSFTYTLGFRKWISFTMLCLPTCTLICTGKCMLAFRNLFGYFFWLILKLFLLNVWAFSHFVPDLGFTADVCGGLFSEYLLSYLLYFGYFPVHHAYTTNQDNLCPSRERKAVDKMSEPQSVSFADKCPREWKSKKRGVEWMEQY